MVCKDCGTENAQQVHFCVGCGAQLIQKPVQLPRGPREKTFPWRPVITAAALTALLVAAALLVTLLLN